MKQALINGKKSMVPMSGRASERAYWVRGALAGAAWMLEEGSVGGSVGRSVGRARNNRNVGSKRWATRYGPPPKD